MKFLRYILTVAFIVCASTPAQTTDFNFSELDFETPQAAIEHFVNAIAQNDLPQALQAFAINDYADSFNFTAMSERLGAIDMYRGLAPSEYDMYAQLNRLELLSTYAFYIKVFCYSFYASEPLDGSIIRVQDEPEKVAAFIASVTPEQLADLTINKAFQLIILPGRMKETWQKQNLPIGADESSEVVVLYELNGQYFLGGFHLLRYGKNWKIDGLYSLLAGMTNDGGVTKMTVTEFAGFIDKLGATDNWQLEQLR